MNFLYECINKHESEDFLTVIKPNLNSNKYNISKINSFKQYFLI